MTRGRTGCLPRKALRNTEESLGRGSICVWQSINSTVSPADATDATDVADTAGGQVRPTHAGMLMFGSGPQFHIPQSEVVRIRYADRLGAGRYVDRKNLVGNTPALIDQVADFLTLHTLMGAQIHGFKRLDRPEYPMEALRE